MSAREVRDRVLAASTLLGNLGGHDSLVDVSRSQRAQVEAMVQQRPLTVQELADLSTAVSASSFVAGDKAGILAVISGKAMSSGKMVPDSSGKFLKRADFTYLPHF